MCGELDPVTVVQITQCQLPSIPCPTPISPKGTALPITPKIKLNVTGRYDFNWGDFNPFVQGAVVYQSSAWPDLRVLVDGAPLRGLLGKMPGFSTVQLSGGVSHDNWTLELSISNLFDTHGQLLSLRARAPTQVCGWQSALRCADAAACWIGADVQPKVLRAGFRVCQRRGPALAGLRPESA